MTPRLQVVAGLIVYVTALAALVVLALTDHAERITEVVTLAGPVVAALLISGHVTTRTDALGTQLAKIDEQTNGVLDSRIETATNKAIRGFLAEYGRSAHQPQPGPAVATADSEGTG